MMMRLKGEYICSKNLQVRCAHFKKAMEQTLIATHHIVTSLTINFSINLIEFGVF